MGSTLPSHGHKGYGGPYKILLPKQGMVPQGTFCMNFSKVSCRGIVQLIN